MAMNVLGIAQTAPAFNLPPGACDCHTHIFGPVDRFPFSPHRVYTPGAASIEDLLALHRALRLDRVVIVHPSPYGADNSCTIDALRRLGARARGVAVIDATTSDAALREMHEAGVRGVRVNLETGGVHDPAAARRLLQEAAARVAPLGWHVQTFTNLTVIAALHDVMLELPTTLVIDHFGRAQAAKGVEQPGFAELLSLVRRGKAYVKLSASYRISEQPDHADAAALARALIDANPDRMVWGSDWPHPGGRRRSAEERDEIEPFIPVDDGRALNRLAAWAGDASRLVKILVDNPARLYGF
jgi:predicted TIM-barrel fold metal-dependent hydrolase